MPKEAIISTPRLNSYGTWVVSEGIDTEQYQKNPVLLYMHRRGSRNDMPIGVIENLRMEGDILYGTPKIDEDTEEERNIAKKWERGTLRMLSAGLDVIEWSEDPALLKPGQTRPTVTKSKLIEVSVVDIGSNDDAMQVSLYHEGELLTLAAGEDNANLPLLKAEPEEPEAAEPQQKQTPKNNSMEKILLKLGLAPTATEDEAVEAIGKLQKDNNELALARTNDLVETAIKEKRINADKKEKYLNLAKQVGYDGVKSLLEDIEPTQKPMELVRQTAAPGQTAIDLKWETATPEQLMDLRDNNRPEFVRLYKEHFGFEPQF